MSSSIRIPEALPIPDRDSFQATFEDIATRTPMEVGAPRVRRARSLAPELFTLTMDLNLSQYQEFDYWYQNTIRGGESEFDMQLLDDDTTLVWYTVRMIGEYQYQNIGPFLDQWQITMTVRTFKPSFADRPPGTNDLKSGLVMEMTLAGHLSVPYVMRGAIHMDMSPLVRLTDGRMYGSMGFDMLPVGRFAANIIGARTLIDMSMTGALAPVIHGKINLDIAMTGYLYNPADSEVVMHLKFDGSDGSTTIVDSSPRTNGMAIVGNARLSTAGAKFGTAGLETGYSGQGAAYMSDTIPTDMYFTDQEWTVEYWMYPTDNNEDRFIFNSDAGNSVSQFGISFRHSTYIHNATMENSSGFQQQAAATSYLGSGVWIFVQVRRRNDVGTTLGNIEMAINGTQVSTQYTGTFIARDPSLYVIGGLNSDGGANFKGYIGEFRMSIGIAREWTLPTAQMSST